MPIIPETAATETPVSAPVFLPTSLATPTPLSNTFVTQPAATASMNISTPTVSGSTILYYAQNGDWLPAVANRFGVSVSEITSPKILPQSGFLDTGTLLIIPDRSDGNAQYTSPLQLIPDSEIVFSVSAVDFDVIAYTRGRRRVFIHLSRISRFDRLDERRVGN